MKHLTLEQPVSLVEWQATLSSMNPQTVFQGYADALFDHPELKMTRDLRAIVDDFGSASVDAMYAIRDGVVEAVWFDPLHNYVAVLLSRAHGDDRDGVVVTSLMQR